MEAEQKEEIKLYEAEPVVTRNHSRIAKQTSAFLQRIPCIFITLHSSRLSIYVKYVFGIVVTKCVHVNAGEFDTH